MKRKDLQGLRGIAIIAVVLFHFFPNLCPSGYLGVDLFFVLSGFLITMILSKSDLEFKVFFSFYYRRVKRIVPLYYLITCVIASAVLLLLPSTFIVANLDSFWKSLLFLSNIGKSNELNYFAEVFSLCYTNGHQTEIQPLAAFSLGYGSLQLASNIVHSNFNGRRRHPAVHAFLLFLVCVYCGILTTCLTGLIILRGSFVQSDLLINPIVVNIGDISYSLYLVHWPICVYIENYFTGNFEARILGIVFSVLSSVILTKIYEKWYLQASYMIIACLLMILVGLNVLVLQGSMPKINQFEQGFNSLQNPNCDHEKSDSVLGWCNYTRGLDQRNPNRGLIIGNSYAANLGGLVWENCGQKMRKLRQYSTVACEPLLHTRYTQRDCGKEFANFLQFVEEEKPDYLFLLARWIDMSLKNAGDEDEALNTAMKRMEDYSRVVVQKIFVLHGFPIPKGQFIEKYSARYSSDGANARSDDLFDEHLDDKGSRIRLETLAKKFQKMVLIDIVPPLTINGTFWLADPSNGVSYFTPDLHISLHGAKAISQSFQDICRML